MVDLFDQLARCRRVAVPIVAIETADQQSLARRIVDWAGECPTVSWDIGRRTKPMNDKGRSLAGQLEAYAFAELCEKMDRSLGKSITIIHNAHKFIDDVVCMQWLSNLRDVIKGDANRTLILLGSRFRFPTEIEHDIVTLREPLPDRERMADVRDTTLEAANLSVSDEDGERAVDAVLGLSEFAAEQAIALSLRKSGIDLEETWKRKADQISQCPALSVYADRGSFSKIGGCDAIKRFLIDFCEGPDRPNVIVFIDEIEKALGGLAGDTSGTTQDQLGVLLKEMEDRQYDGIISVGPPGAAKSAISKAAGDVAQCPTIQLDLGGAKGSLVGQSEGTIRHAMDVIHAVSQGKALWLATSNKLDVIPPELRRRFSLGTFFFDLPTQEERDVIWDIYRREFSIDDELEKPRDDEWTGAEIKRCCRLSYLLRITLEEAAEWIVPVARSNAESLDALRNQADGRFLSASYPGVYRRGATPNQAPKKRKIGVQ